MFQIKNEISSAGSGRRLTLGFMVDWLEDAYQQSIFRGVSAAAESYGVNLISFDGGGIGSTRKYESDRNQVYHLINANNIDGLIVLTDAIVHFSGKDELLEILSKIKDLPKVSITGELPDAPSVLVDNRSGIIEVINHLAQIHSYRKIAFIGGPSGNPDAIERLSAFHEALENNGLQFHEDIYVEGQFTQKSGYDAVNQLLRKDSVFDAVVAANDDMATGVIEALKKAGKKIPGDVAVTGFDNIDSCLFSSPTITTVYQPLYEQGWNSVELLLSQIHHILIPEIKKLPTRIVIRESCGCFSESARRILMKEKPEDITFPAGDAMGDFMADYILNKLNDPLGEAENYLRHDQILIIMKYYLSSLNSENSQDFIVCWNKFITGRDNNSEDMQIYQTILSEIRNIMKVYLKHDMELYTRAEDLCHQGRIVLAEKAVNFQKQTMHSNLWEQNSLNNLREWVLAMLDEKFLIKSLYETLPLLQIKKCVIAKFVPNDDNPFGRCRISFAFSESKILECEADREYDCKDLIQSIMLHQEDRAFWIIESLSHFDQIGFIFLEKGSDNYKIYGEIRRIISTGVQSALLFNQVSEQAEFLKRQSDDLKNNLSNMRKIMGGVITTLSRTVEKKDPYTAGHERRVADLARKIAVEMDLDHEVIEAIRIAGTLHDLGKLYVPSEILNKPGKLLDAEMNLIKLHPEMAYDILNTIEFPWPIADIVIQHHERMDGSGYPKGLIGHQIKIEARIICVADVVEAMASLRPYRKALGLDMALKEIEEKSGIYYDPEVVKACLILFREKDYKIMSESD